MLDFTVKYNFIKKNGFQCILDLRIVDDQLWTGSTGWLYLIKKRVDSSVKGAYLTVHINKRAGSGEFWGDWIFSCLSWKDGSSEYTNHRFANSSSD